MNFNKENKQQLKEFNKRSESDQHRQSTKMNEKVDKHLTNPDMVRTEQESLFDIHEDMQTVDPLPVEELKEKVQDEKKKDHTKDSTASEKKYAP